MRPICAFTIAIGAQAQTQANLLRRTFDTFHSDIPFIILRDEDFVIFTGQEKFQRVCEIIGLRALAGFFLSFYFEKVLHMDSDMVVFNRLEALLETEKDVILTHDIPGCTMGPIDCPKINSGVVLAKDPDFWLQWAASIYSIAFPMLNTIGDQFALRLMAKNGSYSLLDEIEQRVSYNNVALSAPGDYLVRDQKVWHGDYELKAYHWAGQPTRDLSVFPDDIINYVGNLRGDKTKVKRDNDLSKALFDSARDYFFHKFKDFMANLPIMAHGDKWLEYYYKLTPGIMWSFAPKGLEAFRKEPDGNLERRVEPEGNYHYYVDPVLLNNSERLSNSNQNAF